MARSDSRMAFTEMVLIKQMRYLFEGLIYAGSKLGKRIATRSKFPFWNVINSLVVMSIYPLLNSGQFLTKHH